MVGEHQEPNCGVVRGGGEGRICQSFVRLLQEIDRVQSVPSPAVKWVNNGLALMTCSRVAREHASWTRHHRTPAAGDHITSSTGTRGAAAVVVAARHGVV